MVNREWHTDDTDGHGQKLLCKSVEFVRRFKSGIDPIAIGLLRHKSAAQEKLNSSNVAL